MTASSAYATGQLRQAIDQLAAAQDAAGLGAAEARIARWRSVIAGMQAGDLSAGSRTPVAGTPAWVTLEVAHGGFATGRLLAEQPLDAGELEVLAGLPPEVPGRSDRERLNLWFLGDAGQQDLLRTLAEGRYRVEVPEETALMVVAWLLDRGQPEAALDLVAGLRPWMPRLRFTPRPAAGPGPSGALVHVQTAAQAAAALGGMTMRPQIAAMRRALAVQGPLHDRLVALWCETVDGDLPRLGPGGTTVTGGWPCRRWPDGWAGRCAAWLADYEQAADGCEPAGSRRAAKSNFTRLRIALEICDRDGSTLTGRDVGLIRRALANTITRHGAPGSPERTNLRAAQQQLLGRPAHVDLARVVAARLGRFPADGGIPSLDSITAPAAAGESAAVPEGEPVPAHLAAKAARALEAPAEELVERGVIGSAEVLAAVVPQVTAQVLAAGVEDPQLSGLYGQAYAAFRRRRTLLLLNLEHQVRFGELPWIAALQPYRAGSEDTARAARQALAEVAFLAMRGFPQTIMPNPLVSEMTALAGQAGVALPLTEEVAADIFTGLFTVKWNDAAAAAGALLDGTLYARYYDLPAPQAWPGGIAAIVTQRWGKDVAEGFTALCRSRAGEAHSGTGAARRTAVNGTILEQSQILTTHNLAGLTGTLDLHDRLAGLAPGLADRAFACTVRWLAQDQPTWRARLHAVKNAAYAWRQGIFFLSLCPQPVQAEAVARLRDQVEAAGDEDFQMRFRPAVDGLAHIIAGGRFDADGTTPEPASGRRFLGWTAGPHWILNPA
jgi:glutathione S-transferase